MKTLHTEIMNANLLQIGQFEICFYTKKDSRRSYVLYIKNGFRVFASDECWEHYGYRAESDYFDCYGDDLRESRIADSIANGHIMLRPDELDVKIVDNSILGHFVEYFEARYQYPNEMPSNWEMFDLLWDEACGRFKEHNLEERK